MSELSLVVHLGVASSNQCSFPLPNWFTSQLNEKGGGELTRWLREVFEPLQPVDRGIIATLAALNKNEKVACVSLAEG